MFDTLTIEDCVSVAASPTTDPRCSDSAFAAANPSICNSGGSSGNPYLVIKPASVLVCALGSVQFSVFQYANGVETDVTQEATFESTEPDIFAIGVNGGAGTGLASGVTTVKASLNGMTVESDVTVLAGDCCAQIHAKTSILIDNSRSTSLAFGNGYSSRLIFGQAAAQKFADNIVKNNGVPKDSIKVWSFSDVPDVISTDFLTDETEISSEISGITQLQTKTDLLGVLNAAIQDLLAATADEKIILIVSDGEQTVTTDVQPIIDAASLFKQAGGIIMVVGLRASGAGFDLLSRVATGGFFLNAVANNPNDIFDRINLLKSTLCIGFCVPAGNETVNMPTLNYSSFQNWEVIQGMVNLIGNGFMDWQPGNGLYVDLAGGSTALAASAAIIQTIDSFPIVAGRTYRISFAAAGNNRLNTALAQQAIKVAIRNVLSAVTDPNIFDHVVTPNWNDSFQVYSFTFIAQVSANVKISFQQLVNQVFVDSGAEWHGDLLDNVKFDEVTTLTTLLFDNFDGENPIFIPPPSGAYGYDICPASVGTQGQDPNPLPDVESGGGTTQTFTSTKNACANCPDGQINSSPDAIVPDSTDVSDGSACGISTDGIFGSFVNGFFVNGVIPSWFELIFNSKTKITRFNLVMDDRINDAQYAVHTSFKFEGSNDGSTWDLLFSQENFSWGGGSLPRRDFQVSNPNSYLKYRFTLTDVTHDRALNANTEYDVFFFNDLGIGQICESADATSYISQADADAKALAAATLKAQSKLNCIQQYTSTQTYTATCPAGSLNIGNSSVTKSATATSLISQSDADAKALAAATEAAEAALDCTGSNNTQKITINDHAAATAYPSVKYVSGLTGLITKVTATLKSFTHTFPKDVSVLLRAPDGTTVKLMSHCGGSCSVTGLNLVFDDAAGTFLPNSANPGDCSDRMVSGTFKPSKYFANATFPAPAPQSSSDLLSAFNGLNPNGSWSLWVIDDADFNIGQILNGWDLTITTA
jgi:hypothetical protein